jgi:hypothetical protein
MKNFIILFDGQEGSSAIISHLNNQSSINIAGFEPFDNCHLKKPLTGNDFKLLLNNLFNHNMAAASSIYKNYSDKNLLNIDKSKSVGFKMRFRNYDDIKSVLKRKDVVVFVLIRRNVLKWGLSKCRSNSLQFQLIKGEIEKNPKLYVNIDLLNKKIEQCTMLVKKKNTILKNLMNDGVNAHPIYYEDYCDNKVKFMRFVLNKLDIKLTNKELLEYSNKPNYFKKVHDDDISKFIINYDEVHEYIKKNDLLKYL